MVIVALTIFYIDKSVLFFSDRNQWIYWRYFLLQSTFYLLQILSQVVTWPRLTLLKFPTKKEVRTER